MVNPTGALWRILPADKVPAGVELRESEVRTGTHSEASSPAWSQAMIVLE